MADMNPVEFAALAFTLFTLGLALWGLWDSKFTRGARDTSWQSGPKCLWCDRQYPGDGMYCDACLPAVGRFNQYMAEQGLPEVAVRRVVESALSGLWSER